MGPTDDRTSWLILQQSGTAEHNIIYDGRLKRVTQQLPWPERQTPSLVLFLGSRSKDNALQTLLPSDSEWNGSGPNLRLDDSTRNLPSPLLFIDCDPRPQKSLGTNDDAHDPQYPQRTLQLTSDAETQREPIDTIISRLIIPFCDVICVFAADLDGPSDITTLLNRYDAQSRHATKPALPKPRVLIVDDGSSTASKYFRFQTDLDSHQLATVQIVHWSHTRLSGGGRCIDLRDKILRTCQEIRDERRSSSLLFSALHQNALFDRALARIEQNTRLPLDLVREARHGNEVGDDLADHVEHFLRLVSKHHVPHSVACAWLASCTLLDAYPPGMHAFKPRLVYDALYRTSHLHAWRKVHESEKHAEAMCIATATILEDLQLELASATGVTSATIHQKTLETFEEWCLKLKTNVVCLVCLRAKPEHVMSCGHSTCDSCAQIFGQGIPGAAYWYRIQSCALCKSTSCLTVKLKPPTAGMRILCIDGGGFRGIIPLQILLLLQHLAGPEVPVRDLIDLAVGTSVGGLIVLSYFVCFWSINKSMDVFFSLLRLLTEKSNIFYRALKCCLADGMYNVKAWEDALKHHFGQHTPLFGGTLTSESGTKVAVTATGIVDNSARIFTNYNGAGRPEKGSGYRLDRPCGVEHELSLWQAGRATSAAPVLFPPANIPHMGKYIDGALCRHNNPINIAKSESRRIWPTVRRPDVVVSLGTGTTELTASPVFGASRDFWRDGFAMCGWRSFMSFLDGQKTWQDLWNGLDDQSRKDYHRLNVEVAGSVPAMNDVSCMESLVEAVMLQPRGPQERLNVLTSLLISNFYFELDRVPEYESGRYHCSGTIRCRPNASATIRSLIRLYPKGLKYTNAQECLGFILSPKDVCVGCHGYRRRIRFNARSLSDPVDLGLRYGENFQSVRRLSAMPSTVSWFIEEQGLEKPFGSRNHGDRNRACCPDCVEHAQLVERSVGRKRKRKTDDQLEERNLRRKLVR